MVKILNTLLSHLWRYGVHSSTVLIAFVINQAQLTEQHREHPKVLLQFSQPVLVGVGMVRDPVRKLRSNKEDITHYPMFVSSK